MYLSDPKPSRKEAAVQGGLLTMRIRSVARVVLYGALALAIVGVGCKKPLAVTPAAPPAPPPPPAQPTVTLQAAPPTVQRGQTSTLRWSSTNAVQPNTTWRWATAGPRRPKISWFRWEWLPTACRR